MTGAVYQEAYQGGPAFDIFSPQGKVRDSFVTPEGADIAMIPFSFLPFITHEVLTLEDFRAGSAAGLVGERRSQETV